MALSNNWGSYGRKQKAISSRNSPLGNVPLKAVFESLLFYAENPEKKSGNWVITPHNWKELSEFDLHEFRVAHHQNWKSIGAQFVGLLRATPLIAALRES